jgi:translin
MINLESISAHVLQAMQAKHEARERTLAHSRELIRTSANAIRAVHRGEFQAAHQLIEQARALNEQIKADLADHPDLYFSGFAQDAQKEFAEAVIVVRLVQQQPVPGPDELGVEVAPYLNGLGEAVGELRRHILDRLRVGRDEHCESILQIMEDIYSFLITVDYPEAVTGGLRRTTDNVRGILERTRGDLTLALRQARLERALAGLELLARETSE